MMGSIGIVGWSDYFLLPQLMKFLQAAFLTLLTCAIGNAQSISVNDSLKITQAVSKTFMLFDNPDPDEFQQFTTEEIYCIICRITPDFNSDDPYLMSREDFFNNHLTKLRESVDFSKARQTETTHLVLENNRHSDITVYMVTWKRDEWHEGHEGGSVGFYFKRNQDEFRFAGIETIP